MLLLSTSLKLSGIPLTLRKFFRLVSLIFSIASVFSYSQACLRGFLNKQVAPFEFVKFFRKDPFLAQFYSLFSSTISSRLCILPSAFLLFADNMANWPFGSLPLVPAAVEGTNGVVTRLDRECEHWFLPLNPRKCKAFFILVVPHQAPFSTASRPPLYFFSEAFLLPSSHPDSFHFVFL